MKKTMANDHAESGFTLIEMLFAIAVFAMVSATFYVAMFTGVDASETSQSVARISEEARLGLDRMIRDTREGQLFSSLDATSFNVRIDHDADGLYESPNEDGDYENLSYFFDSSENSINIKACDPALSCTPDILIDGVHCRNDDCVANPIFNFVSDDLRFDWNGDGVTSPAELDAAPGYGYVGISSADIELYTSVAFHFEVHNGGRGTQFHGQAQLRNRR